MEELKPCPFCGNKMQITTSKCITADGPKTGYHGYCAECGMHTQTRSSEEQAIADVNRRAAPENKSLICPLLSDAEVKQPCLEGPCPAILNEPLTLEQLRKMDNQPVWTEKRCGVVRADPQITRRPGMPVIHFNYGWEWVDDVLACGPIYAREPEGSEKV